MAYWTKHKQLTAKEEADLGRRAQRGDTEARNQLILNNLPLVHKIASSFDLDPDTAESVGTEALLRAIHYFKPNKGRFSAIAQLCIRQDFGKHKSREHWHSTLVSLDISNPIFEDEEEPLVEQISDNAPDTVDVIHRSKILNDLHKFLRVLTDREWWLVVGYYGLFGYKRQSLTELSEDENVSRETVRLVIMGALRKLRKSLES